MKSKWLVIAFALSLVSFLEVEGADLVLLTDAPGQSGAMCIDGSPPGYYFRTGSGNGVTKFILHLEGGGWCYDEDDCIGRSKTPLGSSTFWKPTANFSGLLSDNQAANPDFYNWNLAYIKYCDGASFAGNVDQPVVHNGVTLHFKGFPILKAVLDSLMTKGLNKSDEVILTGCSAGGLATYLHADYVASVVPQSAKYHTIPDAGYFLDAPNIKGDMDIRGKYQYVFRMQNCSEGVNQACIEAMAPKNETWKCFMAQYAEPFISSRLFGLNSIYDSWQLENILQIPCKPPFCSDEYMKDFENYGQVFLKAAAGFIANKARGYFFDSCVIHCQSLGSSWSKIMVGNQTAATTFADWYFNRAGVTQELDCAYPCNKSC